MNEDNSGISFILGMGVGGLILVCIWVTYFQTKLEAESIKKYIQNPEKFKIEYVTYNGDTTDIIVTYLK